MKKMLAVVLVVVLISASGCGPINTNDAPLTLTTTAP